MDKRLLVGEWDELIGHPLAHRHNTRLALYTTTDKSPLRHLDRTETRLTLDGSEGGASSGLLAAILDGRASYLGHDASLSTLVLHHTSTFRLTPSYAKPQPDSVGRTGRYTAC